MPYPTELVFRGGTPPNMLLSELFRPGNYFFPEFGQKPSDAKYCKTLDDYTKMYNTLSGKAEIRGGLKGLALYIAVVLFSIGSVSLLTIIGEMNFARRYQLLGPVGYYELLMEHRRKWFSFLTGASLILSAVLFSFGASNSILGFAKMLLYLVGGLGGFLVLFFPFTKNSAKRWKRLSHQQCPKCKKWNWHTYYGTYNSWIFLRSSTSLPSPCRPYFYDVPIYFKQKVWRTDIRFLCSCGHNFVLSLKGNR